MKFGRDTEKHMLSFKNAKAGLSRHFPRWPPPITRKSFDSCKGGTYDPILMTFGEPIKKHMMSTKNAKAGVNRHFPRWPPPPSRKSFDSCKVGK
jgi:hypothetical protein